MPRLKINQLPKHYRQEWDTMTADERFDITEPYMEEFKEKRIQRKTAPHNVPIAVFNDASGTIQSLVNEASAQ